MMVLRRLTPPELCKRSCDGLCACHLFGLESIWLCVCSTYRICMDDEMQTGRITNDEKRSCSVDPRSKYAAFCCPSDLTRQPTRSFSWNFPCLKGIVLGGDRPFRGWGMAKTILCHSTYLGVTLASCLLTSMAAQ